MARNHGPGAMPTSQVRNSAMLGTTISPIQGPADTREDNMVEDGFLRVAQAADFLCVSRAKLYALMDSGELKFCKFGKSRRVPRRALRAYAERCMVGTR